MLGRSKSETAGTDAGPASLDVPLLGVRSRAKELAAEVAKLRESQARLGILSVAELEARRTQLAHEVEEQAQRLADERAHLESELAAMRREVVVTEETSILQEVGIYEYRHPLTDAVAYQGELARIKDQNQGHDPQRRRRRPSDNELDGEWFSRAGPHDGQGLFEVDAARV